MPTTAEVNAAAENFIADTNTADAKINGVAGDVTDRYGVATKNLEKILGEVQGYVLGSAGQRDFLNLPAIQADTTLTYTTSLPETVVEGDVLRTRTDGFAYNVTSPSATDYHITTTGGVKLKVQRDTQGFNVKAFGAVGNAVADDTTAFQAAISAAQTEGPSGQVWVPVNNNSAYYKITDTLTITKPISIVGEHRRGVTIWAHDFTSDQVLFDLDNDTTSAYGFRLSGMTLRSNNQLARAVQMTNCSRSGLSDLNVFNMRYGVVVKGTVAFSCDFQSIYSNLSAVSTVLYEGYMGGGQHSWRDCSFGGSIGFNFDSNSGINQLTIDTCNLEQCTGAGIRIFGTVRGLNIPGLRTEGGDGSIGDVVLSPSAGNEVLGFSLTGGFYKSDVPASESIYVSGDVQGGLIAGNHSLNVGQDHFVNLNGAGAGIDIQDNHFAGSATTPTNVKRSGVNAKNNFNASGACEQYEGTETYKRESGALTIADASGAGLTFASKSGEYEITGQTVNFWGYVLYPTTTNASAAKLSFLPAAFGGSVHDRSGVSVNVSDAGAPVGALLIDGSPQTMNFFNSETAAALGNDDLSGKQVYFSGFYKIS